MTGIITFEDPFNALHPNFCRRIWKPDLVLARDILNLLCSVLSLMPAPQWRPFYLDWGGHIGDCGGLAPPVNMLDESLRWTIIKCCALCWSNSMKKALFLLAAMHIILKATRSWLSQLYHMSPALWPRACTRHSSLHRDDWGDALARLIGYVTCIRLQLKKKWSNEVRLNKWTIES